MPLVARDAELESLRDLRQRTETDGAVVALVSGPAGIGKTALADEFCREQPAKAVRRATAVPWESDRPFSVLEQLLETTVAGDPVAAGAALVDSGATVVVVDDAQWCDAESVRSLSSAVRHHPRAPLLILLVRRDGPGGTAELDELIARTASHRIDVSPLTPPGLRDLAAAHGVGLPASLVERLHAHTAGIPARAVDLFTELPAEIWHEPEPLLPPTMAVRSATTARLADCSPQAAVLVEAVAVLGSPASLTEAAKLADLDDPVAAMDTAATTGLLTTFVRRDSHMLVLPGSMELAAVVDSLDVARRTGLHRRAAEIVEDPARRLGHRVQAALLPDAALADQLDALATARSGEGAWAEAGELLTKASRLTVEPHLRDERLVRAVDAFVGAGNVPRASAYIAEIESLRETPMRNAVLGYLAIVRGRQTEAEARLSRAWDLVVADREPEVAALICQRYVLHSLARCQGSELVDWADRAIQLGGQASPARVEAEAIRGLGLAGAGQPAEGSAAYADLATRVPSGAQTQRARMGAGWLNLVLDRVDDAIGDLETAVPTGFLGGSQRISLWARAWLARAHFARGSWSTAIDIVLEARNLVDRTGIELLGPLIHWTTTQVYALRGQWALAEASLRAGAAGPHDYPIMRVPSCLARAHYAEARADYAGVLRALEPLTQPWARGNVDEPGFWPWVDIYANALVLENRCDEAETFLDRYQHTAEQRPQRSPLARLGYARGRLLGASGELDAAREAFENALGLLDSLPLPYDRARVNFAYGQTLRRAGKRREADAVMTTARELYARLGAETYVRRCDRELKAAGLGTTRSDPVPVSESAFEALTPQERAVAGLVARGHSNREVAAEMFLSPKTIQYHLTRIYMKLGIRTRSELAAYQASARES